MWRKTCSALSAWRKSSKACESRERESERAKVSLREKPRKARIYRTKINWAFESIKRINRINPSKSLLIRKQNISSLISELIKAITRKLISVSHLEPALQRVAIGKSLAINSLKRFLFFIVIRAPQPMAHKEWFGREETAGERKVVIERAIRSISWQLFCLSSPKEALKIAVKVAQEIKTFSNCNSASCSSRDFLSSSSFCLRFPPAHDLSIRMAKTSARSMNRSAQIWIRNYLSPRLMLIREGGKSAGKRCREKNNRRRATRRREMKQ